MNNTRTYTIKGAHCGACIEMIKRTLLKLEGVEDMSIDFDEKRISLQTNNTYNETAALAAVSDEGYELEIIHQ